VTHIEGERVYGWGHPFMSLGTCEFPLMTGYIHTVYPRQTVSFKMGSPLRTVGVINADVSTCIAGWLNRKPDMMPVSTKVTLGETGVPRTFNVQTVRQRSLLGTLVFTALTNAVDMEGDLPEELTAELYAKIEIEGQPPLVIKDTFSGFSGGRAPAALYSQVAGAVNLLTTNSFQSLRIKSVECDTHILPGRRTADIEAIELDSENYAPGDTVKARVFLRPYKGDVRRVAASLKLPADLPEGTYSVTASDDMTSIRQSLRDNPTLSNPQDVAAVLEMVRTQMSAKRTSLVLRLPTGPAGVAMGGKSLPNLPASMVTILSNQKRTGTQTVGSSVTAQQPTDWVIQGSESARFTVSRNPKVMKDE
jgi:hypothetical protein